MAVIKDLVGRRQQKTVKFMNEDIKISKLSVREVLEVQAEAKHLEKDDTKGFEILRSIVRSSVEGAADLSDADFDNLPMDELNKLSTEIMRFSGLSAEGTPGKSS
jgi:hypothetical protein